jgi:hypothetical protein
VLVPGLIDVRPTCAHPAGFILAVYLQVRSPIDWPVNSDGPSLPYVITKVLFGGYPRPS